MSGAADVGQKRTAAAVAEEDAATGAGAAATAEDAVAATAGPAKVARTEDAGAAAAATDAAAGADAALGAGAAAPADPPQPLVCVAYGRARWESSGSTMPMEFTVMPVVVVDDIRKFVPKLAQQSWPSTIPGQLTRHVSCVLTWTMLGLLRRI